MFAFVPPSSIHPLLLAIHPDNDVPPSFHQINTRTHNILFGSHFCLSIHAVLMFSIYWGWPELGGLINISVFPPRLKLLRRWTTWPVLRGCWSCRRPRTLGSVTARIFILQLESDQLSCPPTPFLCGLSIRNKDICLMFATMELHDIRCKKHKGTFHNDEMTLFFLKHRTC